MVGDFEDYMHTSVYAQMAKCSTDTALGDICDLLDHGIFMRNPGAGRSTIYRLAALGRSYVHPPDMQPS